MIYILLFQLSFICTIFTITYLWSVRKRPCGLELFLFLFSASEWVLLSFIELFTKNSLWISVVSTLIYLGASTTPIFILLFGLRYTGILSKYSKKLLILLAIFPIISILSAATNDLHHLMWIDQYKNGEYLRVYMHGPLFYAFSFISYMFTCTSGAAFFFHTFKNKLTRKEGLILLVGFMLPWWSGMLYITGWNPFPGLDIIALTVGFSTLFFSYSFRATGLFKDKNSDMVQCAEMAKPVQADAAAVVVTDEPLTNFRPGNESKAAENVKPLEFDTRKEPVNDHNRKIKIYNCMVLSIKLWENATSKSKVEFAEESGLWNVQTDPNGWRRTQTLDRYLSLNKFPEKPRIRSVVKSVEFILSQAHKQNYQDDSVEKLNTLVDEIRYY